MNVICGCSAGGLGKQGRVIMSDSSGVEDSAGSGAFTHAAEPCNADGTNHAGTGGAGPYIERTEHARKAPAWLKALRERFAATGKAELVRWGYIFRVLFGVLASLGVSLFLELDQPNVAMTTALVIMQPQSGAVLSKGMFRMLGTLVGGFISLVIFFLFRQQPPLYLAAIALFAGVCTFGSAKTRNVRSYGFLLAGYTACLIALPHLADSADIFDTAVLRCSEVLVGIICGFVVSEIFFPEAVTRVFDVNVKGRFTAFDEFVCDSLASGRFDQEKARQRQLEFIRAVASLETEGASVSFEAVNTARKQHVRLFATDFMSVTSSFYSLVLFFDRIHALPTGLGGDFFRKYGRIVVRALNPGGKRAVRAEDAKTAAAALSRVQKEASRQAVRLLPSMTGRDRDTVSAGVYLLSRFLTDMRGYLMHYVALTDEHVNPRTRRVFAWSGMDSGIAAVMGLKTVLILVLLSLFWRGADSNNGSSAAIYGMAYCAFLAASPQPVKFLLNTIKGCMLGTVAGLVYAFMILPHISGFILLAVTMLPFIMLAPCLATAVNSSFGVSYGFTFFTVANPELSFNVLPDALISRAFEQTFGIMMVGVVLSVVLPSGGRWWKQHLGKALRRTAKLACKAELSIARQKVEARVRDILLQFYASPAPSAEEKQEMLRRALLINQLSNIMIDMRKCALHKGCSTSERRALGELLMLLDAFFARPDMKKYRNILAAFDRERVFLDKRRKGGFFYYSLHASTSAVLLVARECFDEAAYVFLPQVRFEKEDRKETQP